MTTEGPRRGRKRRFRRLLFVCFLFLIGLSVPMGVYWSMEQTEHRIRATERLLMEELALLRAEVAALSQQQRASQEAIEQLTARTEALAHLWQAQVDKPPAVHGPGVQAALPSAADASATWFQGTSTPAPAEDTGENPDEARKAPFWVAWWAALGYYAMKAGQYIPALYQLLRLHPAIP